MWSAGQRVTALTVRDIIVSSGEYRRGCALAEARSPTVVDPGTYTIVTSTFEPGQLANFVLRVGSDVPVTLRPVLSDAAGRLRTELQPVVFRAGDSERKRARLSIVRLTRASVIARSGSVLTLESGAGTTAVPSSSGTTSPAGVPVSVRVSIEYGTGARAHTAVVTSDGEFADASMGLRTAEVDLDPDGARRSGGLWLVVEQMGLSHRAGQGIQVDVLSDGRVVVGEWEGVDD